jgi:hypothetical protein
MIEQPTLGADGHAIWDPNGKRQQFARAMMEELGSDRVHQAAGMLYCRQQGWGEEVHVIPWGEIFNFVEWFTLPQLRKLRKLAQRLTITDEPIQ